jgi:hypothetical protein
MSWYAAHLVMLVEFKDSVQDRYPVWENIVLVEAASDEEAFLKAEVRGKEDEGDEGGSFHWGKKPAQWVFAGVRKLAECAMLGNTPGDGTEITFNELEFSSHEAVNKFAQGKPIEVLYNDRFATPAPRRRNTQAEPKQRRRKGA